jgi:phosphate starvation-inducible PhoH-like protein
VEDPDLFLNIVGEGEKNFKLLEKYFPSQLVARGADIIIRGEEEQVDRVQSILLDILEVAKNRGWIDSEEIASAVSILSMEKDSTMASILYDSIPVPLKRRIIRPKTPGQKKYIRAIKDNTITFCIGPAGTGKTYLAMAMAVSAIARGDVNRLILVRPAIEAGEKLGYLPGDLSEKISPYLRPLYDALNDMMGFDRIQKAVERGAIEMLPLAYMRGRTLNDAFIIMDEAQNSTVEQMKMFLTRLGFNSRVVVTGDITQVDLPAEKPSGLIQVQSFLKNLAGIAFVYLDESDVVRHWLVQKIVSAYEEWESRKKPRNEASQNSRE